LPMPAVAEVAHG